MFLPHFDLFCDLLQNRRTATWNLFVLYNKKNEKVNSYVIYASVLKDGAYYCYCAYVLRISRYSDFLLPVLTNTGIFLRGLKLSGERRS